MRSVDPAGFDTGAGQPQGVGIIFSEVTPIRIEIRVFKRGQSEMIEVSVSRTECCGQSCHFSVTGSTHGVFLLMGKCAHADDFFIFRDMTFRGLAKDSNVFAAAAMTGFTIAALHVKREPPGVVAACLGLSGLRKNRPHFIELLGVGGRVASGRSPDGVLVYDNDTPDE